MNRIVIIGARGYTGSELLPLLYRHPAFEIVAVGSGSAAGQRVSAHVERMEGCELVFEDIRPNLMGRYPADAYVLALPNGAANSYVEALEEQAGSSVIVDLSADYRFDPAWAYGQPERFADQIMGATRIANPGCYATGVQLALAPISDRIIGTPVAFGVSGYSGAGKKPSRKNDKAVLSDNLLPYSLVDHIHEKEVSHHLGRAVRFMPHVAAFFRGINVTVSAELQQVMTEKELLAHFRDFYEAFPLVEVWPKIPEVREVQGSHRLAIGGFSVSEENPRHISLVAVLDNLLKGAATQAVQNLNLAFGLGADTGLDNR